MCHWARRSTVRASSAALIALIASLEAMDVAVIGAGVGGLTLAKTLLGSGHRVTVYEAWGEWKVRGGALGLQAGRRILLELGLEEDLAKVANMEAWRVDRHGPGAVDVPGRLPDAVPCGGAGAACHADVGLLCDALRSSTALGEVLA